MTTTATAEPGTVTTQAGGTEPTEAEKVKAAADTKAAEEKAAAEKVVTDKAAADAAAAPKAPEKYELAVPESGQAHVDAADLAHLEKMARANNWTNEEAQAALDEHLGVVKAQAEGYMAATKADSEYGGDKLAATQVLAQKAIDRIRPQGHARRESFIKFINRAGSGNHIDVVSFLADIGKLMAEDSPVIGKPGGGSEKKSAEEVLYGKQPAAG